MFVLFVGVSVINFPTTSGNSTGREIFVMFVNLGISFRMLVNDDIINVMPVIGNESLKGDMTMYTKQCYVNYIVFYFHNGMHRYAFKMNISTTKSSFTLTI